MSACRLYFAWDQTGSSYMPAMGVSPRTFTSNVTTVRCLADHRAAGRPGKCAQAVSEKWIRPAAPGVAVHAGFVPIGIVTRSPLVGDGCRRGTAKVQSLSGDDSWSHVKAATTGKPMKPENQ